MVWCAVKPIVQLSRWRFEYSPDLCLSLMIRSLQALLLCCLSYFLGRSLRLDSHPAGALLARLGPLLDTLVPSHQCILHIESSLRLINRLFKSSRALKFKRRISKQCCGTNQLPLEETNFEPQLYQSKPNQVTDVFQVHSKLLKHYLGPGHHQDARSVNYKPHAKLNTLPLDDTMI